MGHITFIWCGVILAAVWISSLGIRKPQVARELLHWVSPFFFLEK